MNIFPPILLTLALLASTPALAAPPTIDSITEAKSPSAPSSGIGQYEKLELEVALTAEYENPFDPDQIDLAADFTDLSGKIYHVNGFFDPATTKWLIRFAPTVTGDWSYTVSLRDKNGAAASEPGAFRCVTSGRHGFITIAPNRRYFRYTDGTSYYPVGLWYNDNFHRGRRGTINDDALTDLAARGVNFISFYPSLLETDATGLGRYDAAGIARLEQLVQWCEQRDLHISWNLVFHANISQAVWGQGNADFGRNPYRTVTSARDYFGSDEAWAYQHKLNRYIVARWGSSPSVFLWFIVDEINGCEGWTEGDRDAAHAWCRRMNDDFHALDPYGRATTGTQSGGVDQWWPEGYAIFDVAGRELYEAQGHPMPSGNKPDLVNDHPLRASYRNYATQVQALCSGFEKPAIIAETGYDHTYYELGTPGYLAAYHNALWSSLASGGAATPFWWAHSPFVTDGLLGSHLRIFADFAYHLDLANHAYQPQAAEITAGDVWAMRDGREIFGWAANPTSGVAAEAITLTDLPNGEYDVNLFRTWRGQYLRPMHKTVADGRLTINIPDFEPVDGHANNLGDDIAFKITPRDVASPP